MKVRHAGGLIVLVCATLLPSHPALAQFSQQGPKLVGTGAVGADNEQGYSVSLSADGNTAIVGGYSDNNSGPGAAWVWMRSGGVWTQQGTKLVGSGAVHASQGASVSLSGDGDTVIVGGSGDNGHAGAAWVWSRSGGAWTQQGNKLVGSGADRQAFQGSSVSLSGDGNTAVVGGLGDSSNAGAAWIWTRSGGVWTQQGNKLVGSGGGFAEQGYSVSLSADGNTAIVGGPFDNNQAGAAWVWTRSGAVWTQQGNKLVGSGAVNANQGWSVSLSADGNTAIVGGYSDNNEAGAAWVWTRSGGVWTQQGNKLVGSGAVAGAEQGVSVFLSADGDTAIIGGNADNGQHGAAWVWTRSGGVWTQQGNKLVGSGAVAFASQGYSVSLSADGNTAIVGGPSDNNFAGAAWVFAAGPQEGSCSTMTSSNIFITYHSASNSCITGQACTANEPLTFFAQSFGYDFGCGLHTFSWSFGDGSTASTGQQSTHAFAAGGSYTVTLTVTNSQQTFQTSTTIAVSAAGGQAVRRRAATPPGPLAAYVGQANLVLTMPLEPDERQFFVLNPSALADDHVILTDPGLLFPTKPATGYRVTFAGQEAMVMLDGTFHLKLSNPLPSANGEIASVDGRIRQSFASVALALEGAQPPPINIELVLSASDDAMNNAESGASAFHASAIDEAAPGTLGVSCVPSGACKNTESPCSSCCLDYNGFCADVPLQRHADLAPGQTCILRLVQFIHSTCYWWVKNGCCITEGAILSIVNKVIPLGLTGPTCYDNHTGRICQSIDYTTLGLQLTADTIEASAPPPLDHDLLASQLADMVVTNAINVPCGATQQLQLFNNTCYNYTTLSLNPEGGSCLPGGVLSQSGTILHYSQPDANTFVHNSQTSVTYTAPSAIGGECHGKGTDIVVAEAAGLRRIVAISVDCNARILNPDHLAFSAVEGGFNPPSQAVTIKNIGPVGSVLNYRLAADASWLTIDGPLRPLPSGDSQTMTIAVNITGLTANGSSPLVYNGNLRVTDADTPAISQSIPVTLTIEPPTQPPVYQLTVATTGSGAGSIEISPPGTSCGSSCSTYPNASSVTLTESPAAGSTFGGWSGACSGSSLQCMVVMTENLSVTASFSAAPSRPTVLSFIANPPTITTGQTSVLSWTTADATSVSISGVGAGEPVNGNAQVSPTATTTYMLTATGPGGTAMATTTLTVGSGASLKGTWAGTWVWSGPGNYTDQGGTECQNNDGGSFSMTLGDEIDDAFFEGPASGAGFQTYSLDGKCTLISTGTASGSIRIYPDIAEFILTFRQLVFSGTISFQNNTLTASFADQIGDGGSGSLTVTRQ